MATDKLRRKLRGWQRVSRNRHLIAEKYRLSDGEFRLLELYRDLTDWDEKHTDTYKTFCVTDVVVSDFLKCDPTTVYRRRVSLLSKGLIVKKEDRCYEVVGCDKLDSYLETVDEFLGDADKQISIVAGQSNNVPVHKEIAGVQVNQSYLTKSPLVSFKGDSVSLIPCNKYLELEGSGRFGNFTADDMEFVEPSSREWELVRQGILAK